MDFTREPIIETVVIPKEGCKLVVRSSKSSGQEEYFVDAVEIVTFGNSVFYRSQERPKAFLVPAVDYEILEVREARMVLKNVGLDRSIKIGGGRETKPVKEPVEKVIIEEETVAPAAEESAEGKPEGRKRDRRRQYRRRRGAARDGAEENEQGERAEGDSDTSDSSEERLNASEPIPPSPSSGGTGTLLSSILPPPPMLISQTISRYKDNALFKGAFYTKEEQEKEIEKTGSNLEALEAREGLAEVRDTESPAIPQPEYGSYETSEEEDEAIYRQRTKQAFLREEDDLFPSTHKEEEEQFPDKDYSTPDNNSH